MKLNTYQHQDFSGGLNDTDDPSEIDRNQGAILRNWLVRERGKLVRRDGLDQVGNTLSGTIYGLHAYLQADGDKDILVMDGTTLKYLNSSTFTSLDTGFSGSNNYTFANVNMTNRVYFGNQDNQVHYWDRASTTANSCLTDLGADIPHGNVSLWFKNHMWQLNNATVSGVTYPERLYFSDLGDPGAYTIATNYIPFPNGGRLITAAPLGESSLVLFQERAVRFLTGYGASEWVVTASANNLNNIDESVGCLAPRGVVGVGNEVWFIDDEANIRRVNQTDFNTLRTDIISTNIQGTLSGVNKTQLAKAVAWVHNDFVFFAIPNGSDVYNSIILVFDIIAAKRNAASGGKLESWTTFTGWYPGFFMSYPTSTTPDLMFADPTNKKVYKWTGTDDDETAVDSRWDGKMDDYKYPERYKRLRFGYIRGVGTSSDINVGIYAGTDGNEMVSLGSLSLQTTGSRLGPTGTDTLGPMGNFLLGGSSDGELKFYYDRTGGSSTAKTIQHSIRHSSASQQPEVNGFTSHYKLRGLR
jgi:hypothetical protein